MQFKLPRLPFESDALAPYLSIDTIKTHYFGHHRNYIDKTNELLAQRELNEDCLEKIILHSDGELFDNASQAWNHTFYWHSIAPYRTTYRGSREFLEAVHSSFESWAGMEERFASTAAKMFGSGYIWLVADGKGKLEFTLSHNANSPLRSEHLRPLWCCDLWEHTYYLDYKNQRQKFVEATWNYVNWNFVDHCFHMEGMPNMSKYMVEAMENETRHSYRFDDPSPFPPN